MGDGKRQMASRACPKCGSHDLIVVRFPLVECLSCKQQYEFDAMALKPDPTEVQKLRHSE